MSDASETSVFLSYAGVLGEVFVPETNVTPGPGTGWIQLTRCSLEAGINLQGRAKSGPTTVVDFGGDAPPVIIMKKTDSATVGLMREFLASKPNVKDASIAFTRTAGDGPAEYLRYDLQQCNIIDFEFLSAGERRADECFKIIYKKLIMTSYAGTDGRKGAQSAAVINNGG